VRFLLDANLSPLLAEALTAAGYDSVHVRDLGLLTAADRVVLERAKTENRVLISADTDFGELLAVSGATLPSVILLRRETDRSASSQPGLIIAWRCLRQTATNSESAATLLAAMPSEAGDRQISGRHRRALWRPRPQPRHGRPATRRHPTRPGPPPRLTSAPPVGGGDCLRRIQVR
jgi:predicted nuclease of predicted toxin-antitoxin system